MWVSFIYKISLWTDYKRGLKEDPVDFQEREAAFGHNRKPIIDPKGYCELVWGALEDFTMRVLCIAAIVSIIVDTVTADDDYRKLAWIEGKFV